MVEKFRESEADASPNEPQRSSRSDGATFEQKRQRSVARARAESPGLLRRAQPPSSNGHRLSFRRPDLTRSAVDCVNRGAYGKYFSGSALQNQISRASRQERPKIVPMSKMFSTLSRCLQYARQISSHKMEINCRHGISFYMRILGSITFRDILKSIT